MELGAGSPAAFLAELEPLRHRQHMARCLALGRSAASGDPQAQALLASLRSAPGAYARGLGLWAWHGDRRPEAVLQALGDDSRTLRRRAAALVHHLDDDHALRALPQIAHAQTLRATLGRLSRQGRSAVLDAFVRGLPEGDPRAQELVPYASAEVVSAWPVPLLSASALLRLARRHPALALEALAAPHHAANLGRVLGVVGPAMARASPDPALGLLERLLERGLQVRAVQSLAAPLLSLRPERVLELLALAVPRGLWSGGAPALEQALAWRLPALDPSWSAWTAEHTQALVAVMSDARTRARWLRSMDRARLERAREVVARRPAQPHLNSFALLHLFSADDPRRAERFRVWTEGQDHLPFGLDQGPNDLRAELARRQWTRVREPWLREQLAAGLPPAEAAERLAAKLRHRHGWERSQALAVVLKAAEAWPDRLAEAAEVACRPQRTDDERFMLLHALAALPLPLLADGGCRLFEPVLQGALSDPGRSDTIRTQARALALRWVSVDPGWATRWMLALRRPDDGATYVTSRLALAPGAQAEVDALLAPAVASLCAQQRWSSMLALAQDLKDLLRGLPSVRQGNREVLRHLHDPQGLGEAVLLLWRGEPRSAPAVLDALLDEDPTLGRAPGFADRVAWARQDLLHVALDSEDTERDSGRFLWSGLDFPEVAGGYGSWTEAQQQKLGERLAGEYGGELWRGTARAAVSRLARLAWRPALLLDQLSHPVEAQREMAVRLLGQIDSRAAAEGALREALGDDRARWAVYAMGRVVAELSPESVLALLRPIPLFPVTVGKEVVRLAGDRAGEGGLALLLGLLEGDLHRDVRIAAQRGLWSHLHREQAWLPFERAAGHEDARVVGSLARLVVPFTASARLADLLARALLHPSRRLRHDLLARLEGEATLDSPALRQALLDGCTSWHPDQARQALAAWADRARPEDLAAAHQTWLSLPHARLELVLSGLTSRPAPRRSLAEALLGQPLARGLALRALASVRDHGQIVQALRSWAQAGELHAALLQDADQALASGPLRELEEALATDEHAALRWLAAGCLIRQQGRTAAQRAALQRRRTRRALDDSPLVRRRLTDVPAEDR